MQQLQGVLMENMIDKARTTVRNGLGETRRALKAMRASPLEDLGLLLALERLAADAGSRDNVVVETFLLNETPDWDDNLEEGAYRIGQEALENIVRHAGASSANISIDGNDDHLELTITDNGRGFDAGSVLEEGRYGLRGMSERAANLGGTLRVESSPGKGTAIVFSWSNTK